MIPSSGSRLSGWNMSSKPTAGDLKDGIDGTAGVTLVKEKNPTAGVLVSLVGGYVQGRFLESAPQFVNSPAKFGEATKVIAVVG